MESKKSSNTCQSKKRRRKINSLRKCHVVLNNINRGRKTFSMLCYCSKAQRTYSRRKRDAAGRQGNDVPRKIEDFSRSRNFYHSSNLN